MLPMHRCAMSESLQTEAAEEARAHVAPLLAKFGPAAVDRFVQAFAEVGPMEHYRHVPPTAAALLATGASRDSASTFLRAALGCGIVRLVESGGLRRLPPRIVGHHAKQLKRISGALAADGDWFDLANDRFLKDMGLVTARLLAAAAQVLDTRCGIPRSLVARQGLAAMPAVAADFARLGGFKPYIQIHTHMSYLDEFSEEGWNECYRCCADLYAVRPDLLGMFGGSWFYDPAIAEISPRLGYLRDVPLTGGARHWFVEAGGDAIANALSTSASRRKLYEEGKYMPKSYMIVWGRREQVAWAARNPAPEGPPRQ